MNVQLSNKQAAIIATILNKLNNSIDVRKISVQEGLSDYLYLNEGEEELEEFLINELEEFEQELFPDEF